MKNLEKIEKFVKGGLEEGELWEFKTSLETNAVLAKELNAYQVIQDSIGNTKKHQLMDTLGEIHATHNEQTNRKGLFMRSPRIYAAAASIIILIAAGISLLWMQSDQSATVLFDQYFVAESASFNVRSASSSIEQPVLQGMQYYELHDYDAALEMFNKAPNNLMGKLYGGLSLMELGDFDKASTKFEYIIEHNDNLFIDQAQWYLGLCYLRTDKQKQAVEAFTKIAEQSGVYKTKAQKILHELSQK